MKREIHALTVVEQRKSIKFLFGAVKRRIRLNIKQSVGVVQLNCTRDRKLSYRGEWDSGNYIPNYTRVLLVCGIIQKILFLCVINYIHFFFLA